MSDSVVLSFLGAAKTVTGSRYLLRVGKVNILVDCGIFQGLPEWEQRNFAPFPIHPYSLDAVILTHAHMDHSGYLPRLIKDGFAGEIYCTPGTAALLRILLPDSGRLQEEQADYANKKGYSRYKPALPLYTYEDACRVLSRLREISFDRPVEITESIGFTPRAAGHILGSAFLECEIFLRNRTLRITFSGDIGRERVELMNPPDLPSHADYVLVESTYGDRLHPREPPDDSIAGIVRRVADSSGVLLIPSFAVGRTQQVLSILRRLELSRKIPTLPIFVDSPMSIDATELYYRFADDPNLNLAQIPIQTGSASSSTPHPSLSDPDPQDSTGDSPFRCRHISFVRSQEESKALNSRRGPMIIIAGSGMCDGGRILHHLKHRLEDKRNAVLLVGFQAEGTKGRLLKNGADTLSIHGRTVRVRAEVIALDGLSAHADRQDLLRWLRTISKPPQRIFVVHGESAAATALQNHIRSALGWQSHIPDYLETVSL